MKTEGKLATGDVLKIYDSSNVIHEYILSVNADINGDGQISPLDYIKVKNHIMEDVIINGFGYLKAADANMDGSITSLDYVRIKNIIMDVIVCNNSEIKDNTMYSINDVPLEYTDSECRIDGTVYSNLSRNFYYNECVNNEWVRKEVTAKNVTYENTSWFDQQMTMQWNYNGIKSPKYSRTCSREFVFNDSNVKNITNKYRDPNYSSQASTTGSPYYNGQENNCAADNNYCDNAHSLKVEGSSNVLFVASHAVNHVREGNPNKANEIYTELICEVLAKITNSSCFSKNYNDGTDPNNTTGSPEAFNNMLDSYINDKNIGLVIDIHGCTTCSYTFNIGAVGGSTLNGHNNNGYISQLEQKLSQVSSEYYYKNEGEDFYGKSSVIINKVKENTNSAAILLEIKNTYRSKENDYEKLKEVISALADYTYTVRNKD